LINFFQKRLAKVLEYPLTRPRAATGPSASRPASRTPSAGAAVSYAGGTAPSAQQDISPGTVVETSDYLPFGTRWSQTGGSSTSTFTDPDNRWRYSGKEEQEQ